MEEVIVVVRFADKVDNVSVEKKNFCVVSYCNINNLPYAKKYIEAILTEGHACTLLFWDREGVGGENDKYDGCSKLVFSHKIFFGDTFIRKLQGYVGCTHYIREALSTKSYDGVIFLQTHAAVACWDILMRKYKRRYIVDIRDYTLENYAMYRLIESSVLKNSYFSVISSLAYKKFLPEVNNYVLAHNYTEYTDKEISLVKHDNYAVPLNISFIGTVRFYEMDMKILKCFANDDRFHINYFGFGSEKLNIFCEKEGIKNVSFCGAFSPEQTIELYKNTDIVNNLYGNHNVYLDYALSNKLYYSAQFCMPILVCPDTYMEEIVKLYNLGFVVDKLNDETPNKLWNWIENCDMKKLKSGCRSFIAQVKADNLEYYNMIGKFVKEV